MKLARLICFGVILLIDTQTIKRTTELKQPSTTTVGGGNDVFVCFMQ